MTTLTNKEKKAWIRARWELMDGKTLSAVLKRFWGLKEQLPLDMNEVREIFK